MSRPSELTRHSLIEEAINVFAAKGFAGGSVRAITKKAKANQAAINYHFGSKEGLYREVLKVSIEAFSEKTLLHAGNVEDLPREDAVRLFVRQQLQPLLSNSRVSRYVRIFAWETLSPSRVFQDYVASEQVPMLVLAEKIVRRYAPADASREEIMVKAIWLANQSGAFVRNFASLSRPPVSLSVDQGFVERLIDTIAALAIAALSAPSPRERGEGWGEGQA